MKYDLYINGQVADTEEMGGLQLHHVEDIFLKHYGWLELIGPNDTVCVVPHVEPVEPIVVEKRPSTLRNLFARVYLFGQGIVFSVQTMFR